MTVIATIGMKPSQVQHELHFSLHAKKCYNSIEKYLKQIIGHFSYSFFVLFKLELGEYEYTDILFVSL